MGNYFSSVITLAFFFSLSIIAVGAQEPVETATLDDEMAVEGGDDVGGEGETNIRETKQDERIEALDKRIDDQREYFGWIIGAMGAVFTIILAGISIFFVIATIITALIVIHWERKHRERQDELDKLYEFNITRISDAYQELEGTIEESKEILETQRVHERKTREAFISVDGIIKELLVKSEAIGLHTDSETTEELDEKPSVEAEQKRLLDAFDERPEILNDPILQYYVAKDGLIRDEGFLADLASTLFGDKEYVKSIDIWNLILEEKPDEAWLNYNVGSAYYRIGDFEKSVKYYKIFTEKEPKDEDGLYMLAVSLYFVKDFIGSLEMIEELFSINDDHPVLWYTRARIYTELDEKNKALYNLAIAIDKDEGYRESARKSVDFKEYRDDPDFRRLVYAEDFNEGEESG